MYGERKQYSIYVQCDDNDPFRVLEKLLKQDKSLFIQNNTGRCCICYRYETCGFPQMMQTWCVCFHCGRPKQCNTYNLQNVPRYVKAFQNKKISQTQRNRGTVSMLINWETTCSIIIYYVFYNASKSRRRCCAAAVLYYVFIYMPAVLLISGDLKGCQSVSSIVWPLSAHIMGTPYMMKRKF